MAVPAELMAALQAAAGGGGVPGGPGGRPAEQGIPGQVPEGVGREPGDLEEEIDADPLDQIAEMIDIAQDFLDREDVPEQGKIIMEKITTMLRKITSSEEKAAQGASAGSLISRAG